MLSLETPTSSIKAEKHNNNTLLGAVHAFTEADNSSSVRLESVSFRSDLFPQSRYNARLSRCDKNHDFRLNDTHTHTRHSKSPDSECSRKSSPVSRTTKAVTRTAGEMATKHTSLPNCPLARATPTMHTVGGIRGSNLPFQRFTGPLHVCWSLALCLLPSCGLQPSERSHGDCCQPLWHGPRH